MKDKKRMEDKICAFSVKIIAEVFSRDNISVAEIKFAETIKAPGFTKAFREVQERIEQIATHRGYRRDEGYRYQYHLFSPFKKI